MSDTIEKVSIIISKGSLEGVYPGLIMANGARMEGIDANLFFTFFGMDAISRKRHEHIKAAAVGNPGLHMATWLGGLPGMSAIVAASARPRGRAVAIRSSIQFSLYIAANEKNASGQWSLAERRVPREVVEHLTGRSAERTTGGTGGDARPRHQLLATHDRGSGARTPGRFSTESRTRWGATRARRDRRG